MKSLNCFPVLLVTFFACSRNLPANTASTQPDKTIVSSIVYSEPSAPACILRKIDSLKKVEVWNPPAEINEYEYDGRKVYSISARCCDFFNTVIDADCKYVCAPSGGFTGRGDGKCSDFLQQAKHLRLVWKDERSKSLKQSSMN